MSGEITIAVIRSELAPGDEVVLSGKRYQIIERGGQRVGVLQPPEPKPKRGKSGG